MSSFLDLAWSLRLELAAATATHLDLVVEALALASLIGVPLGIAATRSALVERLAVGTVNVLQTVPGLALLGFLLIAFRGTIGKPPALAALVLYALLPIVKNTVVGLRGIDRGVAEAALGMGMTGRQRLLIVELPLAVPTILAGVRVAAVATVGLAAIAATIGARNLGTFIYRGISLADPRLILLGSLPSALLALACDAALGELERRLDPAQPSRRGWGSRFALGLAVLLLALATWGAWQEWRSGKSGNTIVIGSKDSAEPILLAHMLAELVTDRTGLEVDRRLNLGGTLVCYNALARGGLDAYVEYTGTALTAILHEPPSNDPTAVLDRVRSELAGRNNITVLDPLGFENTFAILVRREQAEALHLRAISDLRAHQDALQPGFGPEFMNRPDGYPGLVQAYGLEFQKVPREMDRNLLYEALAHGAIDVAAGDSTDGRVAVLDLVMLRDDRRYFPPYEAVPLVRRRTLDRHPRLRDALDALAGRIDAATMRRLNHQVDGLKRDPAVVAREFLRSEGLIRPGR